MFCSRSHLSTLLLVPFRPYLFFFFVLRFAFCVFRFGGFTVLPSAPLSRFFVRFLLVLGGDFVRFSLGFTPLLRCLRACKSTYIRNSLARFPFLSSCSSAFLCFFSFRVLFAFRCRYVSSGLLHSFPPILWSGFRGFNRDSHSVSYVSNAYECSYRFALSYDPVSITLCSTICVKAVAVTIYSTASVTAVIVTVCSTACVTAVVVYVYQVSFIGL